MTKFIVGGTVTVSCWTEVEAEDEAQAREIAAERGMAQLCHQALTPEADEAWHFGEDGEPNIVDVTLSP